MLAESPIAGVLPEHVEVCYGTTGEHDVEWSIAVHLIGDVDVAVLGVVRASHAQACDMARDSSTWERRHAIEIEES